MCNIGVCPEIRESSKHLNLENFKHDFRWSDDKSRRVFRQTKQEQSDPRLTQHSGGRQDKKK